MTPTNFGDAVARETAKAKKSSAANKSTQNTGENRETPAKRKGNVENLKPWQPGQSGNPGGRPKKQPITEALRAALEKRLAPNDERTMADSLADALIEAAKAGDLAAIREIADRVEGKPVQVSQLQGPGGGPVAIDHLTAEEKRKRIAELMAKANGTNGADGD